MGRLRFSTRCDRFDWRRAGSGTVSSSHQQFQHIANADSDRTLLGDRSILARPACKWFRATRARDLVFEGRLPPPKGQVPEDWEDRDIEDMGPRDLKAYDIFEGKTISLEFEGHIKLTGKIITGTRNLQGKILLVTFEHCKVTHKKKVIFESNSGTYSMAVGQAVVSAFNGPADLNSFDLVSHELSETPSSGQKTPQQQRLEVLYRRICDWREGKDQTISRRKRAVQILQPTNAK